MKKTIKTAIAMLLALIMACGSMTAFAATPADIEWNFWSDETVTYSYAGELVVDADTVNVSATEENSNVYCIFEAEEDGYYKVKSTYYSTDWMGIPENFENGIYLNSKTGYHTGEYLREIYYYLEAGEHVLGFDFFEKGPEEVSIEFLGDIVDVVYGEGTFDNLFLDHNVYDYYNEDIDAQYWIGASVTFKFENGEDLWVDYTDLLVYTDEELKAGENEIEIGFYGFDYREKMTITILDITEVITKVELSGIEKYTSLVEHYTGEYYYENDLGGTLTVTYADGTTETVENFGGYGYLEKYDVYADAYYDYNDNWDYCFILEIVGESFIVEECTIREATKFENIGMYNSLNVGRINRTFRWMNSYFRNIFYSDSISEAFGNLGYFFTESASDWLYTFAYIMTNTANIFSYMF